MSNTSMAANHAILSRLKLYFALSRTPHGLLDMCTPALGALLWLSEFPPLTVVVLGLMTAFAGYTAVYALNDIVDYRVDKERVKSGELPSSETYLDDVLVRHPMAYGLLSFKEGLLWTLTWSFIAMLGAYILNPVCCYIFLGGCFLEFVYCFMFRISPLRAFVSGAVKTSGGIAAVFAVDPDPSPLFLILLFTMLFCWEIGGQNVPHDWESIEKDRLLRAKSIPVQWGAEKSTLIILVTLVVTTVTSAILLFTFENRFEIIIVACSLLANGFLLIFPAMKINKTKKRSDAMALFNRASYFPLALLVIVVINIIT